ncbi:XRE family transcriptional regulator [Periweissella cryptocerci]|uniref:XRE family transcriptional regulator n=1 Tax=Periweissella cryptocerci TaxID=2506420 RepID=A0A4P6YTW5_9LACO|nr:helix-turn-helix transcriptional regulator [Periweissella cryptocerci]QBO36141.1 XRE family transcriptional regulator [Periweissella cryptocerci]
MKENFENLHRHELSEKDEVAGNPIWDGRNICKNIKRLRQGANMSQTELAEKLNLARSAISHYESGVRTPSIDILIEMADFFEITVDELIR